MNSLSVTHCLVPWQDKGPHFLFQYYLFYMMVKCFNLKKLNMGLEAYGMESEGLVYQIGVPINWGLSLCIN